MFINHTLNRVTHVPVIRFELQIVKKFYFRYTYVIHLTLHNLPVLYMK